MFLLLLLFEGALRKWVAPSLATPLLIIRDPITILIYIISFRANKFPPKNNFIAGAIILSITSFLFSVFADQSNTWVTLYGIRINYLYIPLIFIIANILNREDVELMGKFIIYCSIGMTCIVILQFTSPQNAWINKKVGGIQSFGITGAEGYFRPDGTFSFVTGIAAFYPLVTAFLFNALIRKNLPTLLIAASGTMTLVAIIFSMSRLAALSCGIVCLVGFFSLVRSGVRVTTITRFGITGIILALAIPFTPYIDKGVKAFSRRWEISTGTGIEGFKENIADRYADSLIAPIKDISSVPFFGYGIGSGSNVGSQLATGRRAFLHGEGEWEKIVAELGIPLGLSYILFRIMLTWHLFKASTRSLKAKNTSPLLLFSVAAPLVLNGQWGPPTILGFAILSAGLVLASTRTYP